MAVRLIGDILREIRGCAYSGIAGGGRPVRGPRPQSQWTSRGAGGTRAADEEEIPS